MRYLTNKTILLLSPQPWAHVKISKHHYAQLLAQHNRVYFVEPPLDHGPVGITCHPIPEQENVWQVVYRSFFPRRIRFHLPWLYKRLMHLQIQRINQAIGGTADLVWSFDFNTFPDLRAFGAQQTIFHPVDPMADPASINIGYSADLIFSVSQSILRTFADPRLATKCHWINHGLSAPFAQLARAPLPRQAGPIRAGCFGNFSRPVLQVQALHRMVREHPNVQFHFWGPYDPAAPLIPFLQNQPHVTLHGMVDKPQLAQQAAQMDLFILAYADDGYSYDRSNAHKLLEYLATGKVVVSSLIETYRHQPMLIRAPADGDDHQLAPLFAETVAQLDFYNRPTLQTQRRTLALENLYEKHLLRIDTLLTQSVTEKVKHA
ncbi:hypothetical protein Mmc1_3089 [Magnetococcus marinus MC-1]|uniref:Glycosyl transferase, group 1 n=1 Tax=Magnetococcus marinus (strain ATCC BAA-1437 / JCM 17883 / MC-1) TaxID=156889 RepID=A0LC87_MAGMM|nr:glycosyltransferase [Magnetococcus marinus]ABK45580.1 hypothetical protein Mmc1_3089 [Magnetococcus marinus MC-1]